MFHQIGFHRFRGISFQFRWNSNKIEIPREQQRSLRVSLVGAPNAGKSVLMNEIMKQKISAVSKKSHTTQSQIMGILTRDEVQLVFYDTPGVLTPKDCGKGQMHYLRSLAKGIMAQIDLPIFVVDTTKRIRGEYQNSLEYLLELCVNHNKYPIFAMNKVDLVKPKSNTYLKAEEISKIYSALITKKDSSLLDKILDNLEAFPVSGIRNIGISALLDHLFDIAPLREWEFEPTQKTNLSVVEQVNELIREKMFWNLNEDLPFVSQHLTPVLQLLETNKTVDIFHIIMVPNRRLKAMIIGKGGKVVQIIKQQAIRDLEALFQCQINLSIEIRVKRLNLA